MKHTKSIFLALFFLASFQLFAQKEETVIGDRGLGFSGIWGGYKHQLTQFGNTNSYVNGGFFGLEFGKSLLIGVGNYAVIDEFKWDGIQNQEFDMRWHPFLIQYGIKNFKSIHPQVGFEIGRGRVDFGESKDRVLVMQPSAGLELNIFRWFHLGVDGGYRFVSDSSTPGITNEDLSGWFGQATLKFGFSWGRYRSNKAPTKPTRYED